MTATTCTISQTALKIYTDTFLFFVLLDYTTDRPRHHLASTLLEGARANSSTREVTANISVALFFSPIHNIQHRKRERLELFESGKIDDLAYMFIWLRTPLQDHDSFVIILVGAPIDFQAFNSGNFTIAALVFLLLSFPWVDSYVRNHASYNPRQHHSHLPHGYDCRSGDSLIII